ncbi:MAG TPA: winged helix-turn-helix domain-containing protein [Kaistia sp.]|nr:winged helix-turn-helix domain-containing protein [Kaistia sp.]
MTAPTPSPVRLLFGAFCLSPSERLITRDGRPVEIGGRSFDLLTTLAERPGRVLSKRELLKAVWPDVVVEDGSLRFHMASLRRILGDGEDSARYIATQVGVGYAFVAPVTRVAAVTIPPVVETASGALLQLPIEPQPDRSVQLPRRLDRLIGRSADLQLLCGRIAETRVFTIVGAAGVGKTSVALEVAHLSAGRFEEGASFVDLAAIEKPDLVASAIANALGISVQTEDPMTVLLGHLRNAHRLLLLDNCEHLIHAVSDIVERISETSPRVSILATSREPLRVRSEHVHWLDSLAFPEDTRGLSENDLMSFAAVELFVERASAANSQLSVDGASLALVADMCRRLDGMALPIELAAMRAAAHGIDTTAKLIGERFSLNWTGRRTALPRQQTLQAALDWSFELLNDDERRLLECLSVFVGPFSIAAAVAVAADEGMSNEKVTALLDQLTTKSLIAPQRLDDNSLSRLLEMTRAYARERLRRRGREYDQAIARRHAAYFLARLEQIDPATLGSQQEMAILSRQLGNIRAALDWSFSPDGNLGLGVRLTAAAAPIFLSLSMLAECRVWCAHAVAALDEHCAGTAIELELQAAIGLCLMFTRGNSDVAEAALHRALDIAADLDDRWAQLRILGRLHIFRERIGDFAAASAWADRAVAVAQSIGEPEAAAIAASLAGISHHLAGDQPAARRALELSLRQSLPSDRARTIHYGFDHRNRSGIALARTLWLEGHADRSRRLVEQTMREAAALQHPTTHCIALIWTLSVHFWTGDLAKARTSLDAFSELAELNALGPYIAAACGFKGEMAIQQGETEGPVDWLEESLARLRAARYELLTTTFSLVLAHGLCLAARYEEAVELLDETIDRCTANGDLFAMPELLRVKARALRATSRERIGSVETLLTEALAWSRRQGALAWELRSAVDLARLWHEHGRSAEAFQLLSEVRSAFLEGFDTTDLRAADDLLATLQPYASIDGHVAFRSAKAG